MTPEPTGVVLARDDGLIDVPGAMPIVPGLLDTIERLCSALGIPTRDERERPAEET